MGISTTPAVPLTDLHFILRVLICHCRQLPIILLFRSLPLQQLLCVVIAICSSWFDACCTLTRTWPHSDLPIAHITNCQSGLQRHGMDHHTILVINVPRWIHVLALCCGCVTWIMIINEYVISCMSLQTTVQILQVHRPYTGVRCQLVQSMLLENGQDRETGSRQTGRQTDIQTDGWTAALLIASSLLLYSREHNKWLKAYCECILLSKYGNACLTSIR